MSRILLVDDDENLLFLAQKFLNKEDSTFKLITTLSAQNALQRLKENHFDVVISDYKMPDMDGLAFLKKLRDEDNPIPFIMFTGHGREEVAMKALNLGADYYLMKGGDPRSLYGELAHIIRKILKQSYAEKALKESEKKYRTLVEQSLQSLSIIQDGRIVFVNPAVEKNSGYTREELLTLSPEEFRDLIHPMDRELVLNRLRNRLVGKDVPSIYECRLIRKDGKESWVRLSSAIIEFQGRPATQVAQIDITEYKQIEKDLRVKEQHLRNLFRTMTEGVIFIDPNGQIIEANPAACQILGLTRSEIENRNYIAPEWDIVRPDGTPMPSGEMPGPRAMAEKHSVRNVVMGVKRPDLSISWINVNAIPLINKIGVVEGVVGTFADITERKRVEEKLKESEELFTQFMNHLPAAAFVKDSEGRTLYANQYLKDVFGGERWIGKTTDELFPKEVAQKMITDDKKALTEGPQIIIEELIDKNNVVNIYQTCKFPIKQKNKSKLLGGIALNITEQKWMEEILKENEARLRQERDLLRHITEMSPIGITIVDNEGKITFANNRAEEVLGLKKDEITSRTYNDPQWHITDFDGNPFPERELPFSSVKTSKKPVYNVNHAIKWSDERQVLLSINASPLFNELGEFSGMVASIEDITEQKKTEEELRKQKEELSQFAHMMTHDLINSLTIIDGYAQLLEDDYDKSHVESILKQSSYMKKLLKRSLELADAGRIVDKTDRLDLNLLVEKVAEVTIPASVAFSHDNLPTALLCDREKLSQIFKNLFENAVIHGEPTVIHVKHTVSDKGGAILIINDGKTIPTEIKAKIFDHGFSTRKSSTGFGLTIVKKLVEAHGWEISVRSTPKTTIFQIDYS
ncbi:MAG: PAS domain S-box protein [Promethearchaeota archaeon]